MHIIYEDKQCLGICCHPVVITTYWRMNLSELVLDSIATVGAFWLAAAATKGNYAGDDAKGKQQQTHDPCAT